MREERAKGRQRTDSTAVNQSSYTLEDQDRMSAARNYHAWQSRLVRGELGRRVVEVGCGVGNFTGTLLECEAVLAVDHEPECIARLQRRYMGQPNLQAMVCDVLAPEFRELASFRPDCCVALNVLEHIEEDGAALRAMGSVLTPGGVVVLMVPAFPALYGPIDRNLGHFRRYRRDSIRRLAEREGFGIRKLHYWNFAGFFGWWVNARVLKREVQSERQIRMFDRYLVPRMSALERVAQPPFGQSLLAVLEKP
jgi:SAM-dependent methyltransferase